MSKLDFDIINEAATYINPLGDREICLRGLRIQKIENLVLTKDQNQALDFTDNDILRLSNFPTLTNLTSLYLGNNRVTKIEPGLNQYIPNLKCLVLTNNSITDLGDLDPLGGFEHLEYLILLENPVVDKEFYRLYVIHRCRKLRILDFKKIKDKVQRVG